MSLSTGRDPGWEAAFRMLAAQVNDLVGRHDAEGIWLYVSPSCSRVLGYRPEELHGRRLTDQVHPDDRSAVATAVATGETPSPPTVRLRRADGSYAHCRLTVRGVRDGRGGTVELLTVARDLSTGAEVERGSAGETTAAVIARIGAITAGLAAIIWKADARTWEFTFVSAQAEEMLGYPVERWLGDPEFWSGIIHPDDRDEALQTCTRGTAEGRDYDFSYRAVAADGRVVWLHDLVHVVCDADGDACELHGVLIDITVQKRREQAAALLAAAGGVLAGAGTLEEKLSAVAGLAVGDLADLATVWVQGGDGRYRPVAAAPAQFAPQLLAREPFTAPAELRSTYQTGRPFVAPSIGAELLPATTGDEAQWAAVAAHGSSAPLLVPLVADGQVVGLLSLVDRGRRRDRWDELDLALAGEFGQRIASMVAAERIAARQRQLQRVTTALASAGTLAEVAEALVTGLAEAFGASAQSVYAVEPDGHGLRQVHAAGYAPALTDRYRHIDAVDRVPIADCARTGEPVWLGDPAGWRGSYPQLVDDVEAGGHQAAAALPLRVGGRVVGVLAASFPTPREFPADEREFVLALVGQAAQAFQRAVDADQRRSVAEILQHSLLPPMLPELSRVALAAHYQPAAAGSDAGGDWYDVLLLDDDRVAVVVGDVVGQGPAAAAVMGQLRSALAAYLVDGHSPAAALRRLDRFAAHVAGARASTAVCVVLDTRTRQVCWARAGHPPPLVVGPDHARYLDGAGGRVLGMPGSAPHTEEQATLAPGHSVLLYTDGLVERRGEPLDQGLARLADAARRHGGSAPRALISAVLDGSLDGAGLVDDVALIVARPRPAPLDHRFPAVSAQLAVLRRALRDWATAAALSEELAEDLQLAVGEAAANSVEHAYADRPPGSFTCRLGQADDGSVRVEVRDDGSWRPIPADPGYRGRGLQLIRALGRDVTLDITGTGTSVRFTLPTPAVSSAFGSTPPRLPMAALARPAELIAHRLPGGGLRLHLCGDLDQATLGSVRGALLRYLRSASEPITLDMTDVSYVSSAGVALLAEVAEATAGRLRVVAAANGAVARVLALTGLDQVLPTSGW
jgi:anti-anti-sigma factor